jgi:uncharacterized protein YbaA (DUF1428 family)
MNNKFKSATTETIKETGSYIQLYVYRVPKKNHNAMVQLDKQIMAWFNKHGVRMSSSSSAIARL